MTTHQVMRILRPALALAALALALIALGLLLTGPVRAASPSPLESLKADVQRAARTRGAIVQFGEDVTVPAGERAEAVVAGGGDVTVDGTVTGSVVAFGGDVLVRGTVENDIVAFGGDVRLAPTAVVGGTMSPQDKSIVLIGGALTRDPGAQVTGDVQRINNANWPGSLGWVTQHTVVRPWWGFTLMGWIVQTAFYLVLALVVAALMPRQLRAVQRHVRLKPAASLGWGALIFFIAGPAVLIVLVISIVGLLVVLPYILLVLLAYFFATTAVAAFVAQRVLAGSGQNDNLMLATTLGVIGTTIVSRIPVLGPLVVIAMILFGTGAGALAIVEWRQARKLAVTPPPPGAPVAAAAFAAPPTGPVSPAEPATAATLSGPAALETAEPATAVMPPVAADPQTAAPPADATPEGPVPAEPAADASPAEASPSAEEASAAEEPPAQT